MNEHHLTATGLGPLLEVDTTDAADAAAVASRVGRSWRGTREVRRGRELALTAGELDKEGCCASASLTWVGTRTTEYAATVAFFKDVLGLGGRSSETDFAVLEVPCGATVEVFGPKSQYTRISPPRGRIPGRRSRAGGR